MQMGPLCFIPMLTIRVYGIVQSLVSGAWSYVDLAAIIEEGLL